MVFPERLPDLAQIGEDLFAVNVEERPDEGDGPAESPASGHSGESGEAGSTEDAVENGFDLIVGGMGERDVAGAASLGDFGEEAMSPVAGGRFETALRALLPQGRIEPAAVAREAQFFCQTADKGFVGVGFGPPELVIKMGDGEAAFAALLERREAPQQGNAVSSPGNGCEHGDVLPCFDRPLSHQR